MSFEHRIILRLHKVFISGLTHTEQTPVGNVIFQSLLRKIEINTFLLKTTQENCFHFDYILQLAALSSVLWSCKGSMEKAYYYP